MAEFEVVVSELGNAAQQYKNQADAYQKTADAMLAATAALTEENWVDEASPVFMEKMEELRSWCSTMTGIIQNYAAALTKIGEQYQTGDAQAASQFKR